MEATEFIQARHYLDKTQSQLARMLSVSPKAVQSFEQDWRKVPTSVERQLMFLLYLKTDTSNGKRQCWDVTGCPDKWRKGCVAWEFRAGHFCWFINGTFCQGQIQECWNKKIETCRGCEVFRMLVPFLS